MSSAEEDWKARESAPQPVSALPEAGKVEQPQLEGRDELLSKARVFLTSPSVQSQDVDAKRTFLREKGLSEHDIEDLLRTSVSTIFSMHVPCDLSVMIAASDSS